MFRWLAKELKCDKKGFTLIELVVVIAILGILTAIAVPKYSSSRANASITAHNTNVKTLESAASMYIADGMPGFTGNEVVWPTVKSYENYLQEWPEISNGVVGMEADGVTIKAGDKYSVTINKDGTIAVTPGKIKTEEETKNE